MTPSETSLEELLLQVRRFVEERNWQKYHKPSALAISAAIETSELLELFQWRTDEEIESQLKSDEYRTAIADEVADVMIYLLRMCDRVGISPSKAITDKLVKNAKKYPAEDVRGRLPVKVRKPA
ncbi:MAG: nucleotide pyrophosphohydrolase [Candidatus Thorarchaeota archaeon]|nr:MAG: nucleotide pyrophosphohydrolase [Candidatus Thorarchaeota archaeon]